ncbi:hypothetical protein Tco_0604413 [Tanacetum coccineum]
MTDAKEMWDAIKSRFGGNDESKKMQKYILKLYPTQKDCTKNVAFVSSESTSSTNDVSTAYGVSTSSGYNSQRENSSSYTDELIKSWTLKWQVAPCFAMRLKMFYKETGHFARECRSKESRKQIEEMHGNTGYRAKRTNGSKTWKTGELSFVNSDGEGVDWTGHARG